MGGQLIYDRKYVPDAERDYGFRRHLGVCERMMAVLANRLRTRRLILGENALSQTCRPFPWAVYRQAPRIVAHHVPDVTDSCKRLKSRPAVRRIIDLQNDRQNRRERKRTV